MIYLLVRFILIQGIKAPFEFHSFGLVFEKGY